MASKEDKEKEYPTKVSGWKVGDIQSFFGIERQQFKDLRQRAGNVYNDADDRLVKQRKGEAVPESLNSRGAKNYVKLVAQVFKDELADEDAALVTKHEDDEERLDTALQALVQMGAKESKKFAAKVLSRKRNSSASPMDYLKEQPDSDSDSDEEAEELEPSASPEYHRHEQKRGNDNAHASATKFDAVAKGSGVPNVVVAVEKARADSPAMSSPARSTNSVVAATGDKKPLKATGEDTRKRNRESASLDAESPGKSGNDTQAKYADSSAGSGPPKRLRTTMAQGIGQTQQSRLTFGPYRPQLLSKLLDVFVHATDTVGSDYAMRVAADIDANEHLNGDAAIETLTKMLVTVTEMEKSRPI